MKIGVLDSDGRFDHIFFEDKKLKIIRKSEESRNKQQGGFTHGEYVCSHIFKENGKAEVILVPIINGNLKCSVQDMIDGIQVLVEQGVDLINLSIGDEYKYHPKLEEACWKAWQKGILIVAAHSNRDVEATYPASLPFVMGVNCKEDEKPSKILQYDLKRNEVIFTSGYFSIYHLGIPKLLSGNSFACAKITGLLSRHKANYQLFINKFEGSIFNTYYPYQTLKEKKCLFLTNRPTDSLQQRFIEEVTNTKICRRFQNIIMTLEKSNMDEWDIIFIDHNHYREILPYKTVVSQMIIRMPQTEFVLRYPLYNLNERMDLYFEHRTVINQFYI